MAQQFTITPFHRWIANTIADLGGSAAEYLQALPCKQALTVELDRTAPCQGAWREYLQVENREFIDGWPTVSTNSRYLM